MSKRIRVVVDDAEFRQILAEASKAEVSVSEWVRLTLRAALAVPSNVIDRKLRAVRAALSHDFPTADLDIMLREVEAGRGAEV